MQGMVFAATEAEWKAYEQLSCKAILGMPLSPLLLTPRPSIHLQILRMSSDRHWFCMEVLSPSSVGSMLQRLVGGEQSISKVAKQKPLTS